MLPSQFSASGCCPEYDLPKYPTATQSVADTHETPYRMPWVPAEGNGSGWRVQVVVVALAEVAMPSARTAAAVPINTRLMTCPYLPIDPVLT